ncbi:MAG TPA: F0F1 ATP synthase subunit delta [Leucothrix mucor]|nr:F0F1 ATP synthase subunit delta [Leucothrix mucor]
MSELTTAARPYARAVFEMANESGSLAEWSESLSFMGAIADDADVVALLAKPKMAKQAGAEAFIQLCDEKLDDKAQNLVRTLADNNRIKLFPEISALFEVLKDDAEGSVEAIVTSAKKLTKAEEKSISDALKKRLGREVKLKVSVDGALLGGAIIKAGDLVIDGSIQGRLKKMKMTMAD